MMKTTLPGRKTILLVQDEGPARLAGARTLQDEGYEVITASTGQEATETAQKTPDIGLILIDIGLGNGTDGPGTARAILGRRDIPVVFLVGPTDKNIVENTGGVMPFGYVVKGSGDAALAASCKTAFRLHEAHRELKRKEEMLRTGEERSRRAEAIARVGNWEIDIRTNKVWASEEALRIYGIEHTTSELPFTLVQQNVLSHYRPALNRAFDRLVAQVGEYDEEFQIRRSNDGLLRFIHSRAELILAEDGTPARVAGVIQDITERKKMEEALRESETALRAILDSSRDAIGVSKHGTYAFANLAYVSLFGYESADELIGVPIVELIAPESRAFVTDLTRKRAAGEPGPSFYEVTALKKDGTTFLMEVTASSYTLKGEQFTLVILRDITERRKAEEEVRLLKHSIDVHYDSAFWMTTDNRFAYVNDAACKATGYEREDLIGKTVYQVNPKATPERMESVWEELRKGGSFLTESVGLRKDGSEFPVELVTTYVQFGGREYACGFIHDISEKKRLEEQLRQAQKMEAVGTLAGGVAHDFNNLLTVIMGFANLIQMRVGKDSVIRPQADQIMVASERAADLIRSLLAFSRKQRIVLEPHKVNGVVASTVKLLARLLPEDIDLEVNLSDRDTLCLLDVTQIGQVLMNLATNARDAMPHGGSLSITTEVTEINEAFEKTRGFERKEEYVKLSVSDTGIGMDRQTIEHIFEPFFTTKEVGKGTGLGLASAYGIVEQHNGYITVSSTLFKGTTFDIYLPLVNTLSPQKVYGAKEIKGGTETILVVEDERSVRNMLTEILKGQGYTTIEAVDGNDAIRVHRAHREHIKLIILDVVMPGKNGKEALDEIVRTDPGVKAIFTSGYAGDIMIDKGIKKEGVDFLHKPISVAALLAKVREVLDR